MSKTKKKLKLDVFPRELFAHHYVETSSDGERNCYVNSSESEEDVFHGGSGESHFAPGERVAIYRLVEVVKLTRKTTITRKRRT